MSRAKETVGKKEVRNKQIKKRQEKERRKLARKEQGKTNFDDMLAWVDANGQLCSAPPSAEDKEEVKVENIAISTPKGGIQIEVPINKGRIKNYDSTKGYGFISSMQMKDSIFFHINDCTEEVKAGDKVEFETENGQKGMKAVQVKKIT